MLGTLRFKFWSEGYGITKYRARAVKGGDLRSSACSAWVRIPPILFFSNLSCLLLDLA